MDATRQQRQRLGYYLWLVITVYLRGWFFVSAPINRSGVDTNPRLSRQRIIPTRKLIQFVFIGSAIKFIGVSFPV